MLDLLHREVAPIVDRLLRNEEHMSELWRTYTLALARKALLLSQCGARVQWAQVKELRELTTSELADIGDEEYTEEEIISGLTRVEHDRRVKRVHRLEESLNYARTQYDYTYELVEHLRETLKYQLHLLKKLADAPEQSEQLTALLKQQFAIEKELAEKLSHVPSFHQLWERLQKGEHTIRRLDGKLRKLSHKLIAINTAEEDRTGKQTLQQWGAAVAEAIDDRVHEGVATGNLGMGIGRLNSTDYADFEFVNSPDFVELAREKCYEVRGKDPSQNMLVAFVHMFREWFTHYRD